MDLASLIRTIPDFPKPGIQFKDIESITEHPEAFAWVIQQFADECENHSIDRIVALDARGFLFGAALGLQLGLPVVMARKKGKLGGDCVSETYSLEYGEAEVELQKTAIKQGDQVLIIDDLLATGGTASAAAALVNQVGGNVRLFAFVIELAELNGRARLGDVDTMALVQF
ncbi:adenine phosphoribosyltransferase [Arenicella xantha]|uniref:Adenine phosphoribosyltransferase n=1 Tax=Arenicella xantha TaxID=644221 RepID=A0A395JQ06_9GAMM|nr:adenine phosphoribosyltransferase [Arenicella xantha]RBP53597.1 adenine phosphoribosyltransferase [Arenicella xantha]